MELTKNNNGTYTVELGDRRSRETMGLVFPKDVLKQAIERFNKRGGTLCEFGFPRATNMVSHAAYVDRFQQIHPENICAKLYDLKVEDDSDERNPRILATMILSGPKAGKAARFIEFNSANMHFGMRALTHYVTENGVSVQQVRQIISWDLVNSGLPTEPSSVTMTCFQSPVVLGHPLPSKE